MRQFYRRVHVDKSTMHFCAACELCEKKQYAMKLPLLCRRKSQLPKLERGENSGMIQSAYIQAKMHASRELAKRFNYCRGCGKWVCDVCFNIEGEQDHCIECAAKTTAG